MQETATETATQIHPHLRIKPVVVVFRKTLGESAVMVTESSCEAFRTLENAAFLGFGVSCMSIDGRELDADSLGALNSYLRTPRALQWNGVLPFTRTVEHRSRWAWDMFVKYLNLTTK